MNKHIIGRWFKLRILFGKEDNDVTCIPEKHKAYLAIKYNGPQYQML